MTEHRRAPSKTEQAKGIVGALAFVVLLTILLLGGIFIFIYGGSFVAYMIGHMFQ